MKNQSFLTRATRLLPLFLLLVLPAAVQGQFTYQTNNGGITITSYRGSDGTVIIPSTTNGLPVTGIGDWAFEDASSMTNVTIPGSVTNIGDYAFDFCSALTSVTIPGSVIHIGLAPFVSCKSLTAITVGDQQSRLCQFGRCAVQPRPNHAHSMPREQSRRFHDPKQCHEHRGQRVR